jgi:hypothetical protein
MPIHGEKIQKSPDVVGREVADGEGVLLHVKSGSYHGLNDMGWTIWGLIDGDRTATDVVNELRPRVDDLPDELAEDVEKFLRGLRNRGLIE